MEPQDPIQPNDDNLKFLAAELGLFLWMDNLSAPAPEISNEKSTAQLT